MSFLTGQMSWFEFKTTQHEGSQKFYGQLFNWKFTPYGPSYWGISCEGAVIGGMEKADPTNFQASSGFIPYFSVPSTKEGAQVVLNLGGNLNGETVAITNGDDGYFQKFTDLDGNQLALWSKNP